MQTNIFKFEEAVFIDLDQGWGLTPNPEGDAAEDFLFVNCKPALLQATKGLKEYLLKLRTITYLRGKK